MALRTQSSRTTWHFLTPALLVLAAGCLRTQSEPAAGPIVVVEASCPGLGAGDVAALVAEPIERQVEGVEKLVHMRSRSTSDGAYQLELAFRPDMPLDLAEELTRNRVALATPILPASVQKSGLTTDRKAPRVAAFVTVSSPNGSRAVDFLAAYADAHLKDPLERLNGVVGVSVYGRTEYVERLWIDRDRLRALELTEADVAKVLEQALAASAQAGEQPPEKADGIVAIPATVVRLLGEQRLHDLEIGPNPTGQSVPLGAVARVELGARGFSSALLDGKPAVVLAVRPRAKASAPALSAAIQGLLDRLRPNLPPDVSLDLGVDFSANLEPSGQGHAAPPSYMLIDVYEPPNVLPERTLEDLRRCEAIVRAAAGVTGALALTQHPLEFPQERACVLVRVEAGMRKRADRAALAQTLRTRLAAEVRDVVFQIRDLSGPRPFPDLEFPVDLAVRGPRDGRYDDLLHKTERLLRELTACPALTDVMINRVFAPADQVVVSLNEEAAKAADVPLEQAASAVQALVTEGASLLVIAPATPNGKPRLVRETGPWRYAGTFAEKLKSKAFADALKSATVRTAAGKTVPLAGLVVVRAGSGPGTIERLDGQPMVEITANLAPGADPVAARRDCERLVNQVTISPDYAITWLRRPSDPE